MYSPLEAFVMGYAQGSAATLLGMPYSDSLYRLADELLGAGKAEVDAAADANIGRLSASLEEKIGAE